MSKTEHDGLTAEEGKKVQSLCLSLVEIAEKAFPPEITVRDKTILFTSILLAGETLSILHQCPKSFANHMRRYAQMIDQKSAETLGVSLDSSDDGTNEFPQIPEGVTLQ